MQYEFTKTVTVEGREYKAGDKVDSKDLLTGSVQSMARVGWIKVVPGGPKEIPQPKK